MLKKKITVSQKSFGAYSILRHDLTKETTTVKDVIILLIGMYSILLDFLIKIVSECNMYVCPLNMLSPFTVGLHFYLQIQCWEHSECGKDK